MRLALAFCLVVALLGIPTDSGAMTYLEVDLDGVVGNGPDFVYHQVSDYCLGDLWLVSDEHPTIAAFDMSICNYDYGLEFQAVQFSLPVGWEQPTVVGGTCVRVWAWDPEVTGVEERSWGGVKSLFRGNDDRTKDSARADALDLPAKVGTIVYHAAVDASIAELYLEAGTVTLPDGTVIPLENAGTILGLVMVGFGDSQKSEWGASRGLFR